MVIGDKIKEEVTKRGLSITEFAKLINKSRNYVYAIFEKDTIDTGLLSDISIALELPITHFFDDCSSTQNSTGNSNVLVGGDNHGSISTAECQDKLDDALLEIRHLKERLKDKEEMIVILKELSKSNNEPSDAG